LAITDPQDTLAYHASRVFCQQRDMSEVSCEQVAKVVAEFKSSDPKPNTVPETDALWFYGMNHGVALIAQHRAPLEPLDPWELSFVQKYHEYMGPKAVRAFYYLIWICIREARHNKSLTADLPKIEKLFGEKMAAFMNGAGGEDGISKRFLDNPPPMTIGNFVKAIAWQFDNSTWHKGYGGKKWGVVTDCLVRFCTGEYSAEVMLDQVWTLAHNGGPIFNKGFCYDHYDSIVLYRILDVQRSGQVPEACLFDVDCKQYAALDLIALMKDVKDRYPVIGDYVDWIKVEALGAVKTYEADIENQSKTPEQKAAEAELVAKKKALAAAAQQAIWEKKNKQAKDWFQVMPGLEVKKIVRAA
jgi:hypothetical protein